ncbi:MAG: cytochrome c biogenesis protein CcdA [Oscillospiraceae bacterium]|nr:cytochrome c biogenesis protein CcdA [Oscillospiraceae bacterium]
MEYVITFLEGVVSFISPCMLPLLPLYVSYFAAGEKRGTLLRAACFVAGFTVVFTVLGVFAGTVGAALARYRQVLNIVCGLIVALLGLGYLEVIPLPMFKGMAAGRRMESGAAAFAFGVVYSVSLTPCVGAFLGSALMLASTSGGAVKGGVLLVVYSLGLGVPFLLSAALLQQLKGAFDWVKTHYRIINTVCGVGLIVLGVLMATGVLHRLLTALI